MPVRCPDLAERLYVLYVDRIVGGRRPMDDDYAEKVRQDRLWVADGGDLVGLIVLRYAELDRQTNGGFQRIWLSKTIAGDG